MSENNTPLQRIRLTYSRGEELRYVSHLDMHLMWERTFRRARLPLAYSQGFNPHPRMHLASALPLGFLSRVEIIDVWLEGEQEPSRVQELAQASTPPGLKIYQAELVPLGEPALQTQVSYAEYLATPLDPLSANELEQAVQAVLAAKSLPRERRGKAYDLRPLIETLEVHPSGDKAQVHMRLSARESATGRPEEVIRAMELDPTVFRVERTGLILSN